MAADRLEPGLVLLTIPSTHPVSTKHIMGMLGFDDAVDVIALLLMLFVLQQRGEIYQDANGWRAHHPHYIRFEAP